MQRLLAVCEPLGTLMPGPRPLEGKSFYLDELKSNSTIVLTKLIIRLGGNVESFLYKDVNVVITGNRDTLRTITASSGKVKGHNSPHEQRESRNDVAQRPGTPLRAPVCGSRGKALLEKAIRNNEQSRGGVLSSAARYWGVKIVSVEQFMKVVEDLSSQHSTHTHRKREDKNSSLCIIKAGSLKVEFVKVEDSSRKYRPLHCQSLDFPMLSYTRRFSPFENPAPVQLLKTREDGLSKDKFGKNEETISSHDKLSAAPSPKMSHKKKNLGYCECCQRKYSDQDEHLRSDVHLRFVEDFNNYAVVDQLMSAMADVFSGCKDPQVDALMMRFSSGSVALPSEIELQCKSEMETCLTNQEVGPASHVQVQQERICDSSVQLQEPCADAPPFTSLETKFVDEKRDSSNSETNIPSPRQQHDFILDSKPVEFTTPSPRLVQVADSHKPSTLQEPAEISQRHLPSLETLLNDDNDSATCLKSPKKHQEDTVNDLPPCSWLMEREQTHMVETTSCSPSFHSLPQSLSTRISDGENPRKRSRSFTLSPKASKVRRTSLRSEPTNQNSGVDVRFHHLAQSGINRHTEANDVTQCKRETAEQHPSLNASLNVPTPEDDQQEELVCQIYLNNKDASSELGPPQLYPFFQDDVYQNQPFLEPPKLVPSIPFPSTNKTSSNSHLSQSFSSICIESALVPDTFSPASSESDWDSGLLSLLAPQVHRQPKVDRCELDLGLLLQSPCSGMQDGSYASRLCSVLQPTASSSHTVFGDPNTIYRPIKTMDRRIIQSLGV
ncbi:protein DBF4 homolog A isoform X2 [Tachysurus fulvidraco]|uniref:protein DBF4 homolog A isoform X2 n=2 Tax=Tachysurus fulvidraco TaxID=1234273 RepID=UPI000F50315C|nr:protein DBF4 homolog A isoform X2 [Tachysurus fulvidraco]